MNTALTAPKPFAKIVRVIAPSKTRKNNPAKANMTIPGVLGTVSVKRLLSERKVKTVMFKSMTATTTPSAEIKRNNLEENG